MEAAVGESDTLRDAQHDMQAAVRFLRANAAQYGIDPERIAVGGSSAGAVTALPEQVDCAAAAPPVTVEAFQSSRGNAPD